MDDLLLDKRQDGQSSPKGKGPDLEEEEPHLPETRAVGVPWVTDTGACDGREGPPRASPLGGTVQYQDHQRSDEAPGARAVQGGPCGTRQEQGGDDAQRRETNGQGTGDRE